MHGPKTHDPAADKAWSAGLEAVLGVPPDPVDLFLEAFTHPSFAHEQPEPRPPHNQRLEFLGDAVVGLVVAHELWKRFPHLPEGDLTRLRIATVNSRALAEAARALGLGRWLRTGRGHELGGGREQESTLSDLFEAVAGAVFVAHGLPAARDFVLRGLADAFASMAAGLLPGVDAKTQLQERLHTIGMDPPRYRLLTEEGPPHARTFRVAVYWRGQQLGVGQGGSKKAAEQAAAAQALVRLADPQFVALLAAEAEGEVGNLIHEGPTPELTAQRERTEGTDGRDGVGSSPPGGRPPGDDGAGPPQAGQ
ncbi:MAG TPA: ribonuclease III [Limnochordales bacterium]